MIELSHVQFMLHRAFRAAARFFSCSTQDSIVYRDAVAIGRLNAEADLKAAAAAAEACSAAQKIIVILQMLLGVFI